MIQQKRQSGIYGTILQEKMFTVHVSHDTVTMPGYTTKSFQRDKKTGEIFIPPATCLNG